MRIWKYIYFVYVTNISEKICKFSHKRETSYFWYEISRITWRSMNDYLFKCCQLVGPKRSPKFKTYYWELWNEAEFEWLDYHTKTFFKYDRG